MARENCRGKTGPVPSNYIVTKMGQSLRFIRWEGDFLVGAFRGKEVRVHRTECESASNSQLLGGKRNKKAIASKKDDRFSID